MHCTTKFDNTFVINTNYIKIANWLQNNQEMLTSYLIKQKHYYESKKIKF